MYPFDHSQIKSTILGNVQNGNDSLLLHQLLVEIKALKDAGSSYDEFFLCIMAVIVFLMQGGFAFLEAGALRPKNVLNVLTITFLDTFVGAIVYFFIGFALAYGEPGNPFCGSAYWAMSYMPDKIFSKWFFHCMFAIKAVTIVSGAVAERCELISYLIYSCVSTGFMYPIVSHWVWSESGWLRKGISVNFTSPKGDVIQLSTTYQDFAGSGVVHIVGGSAAFLGAWLLGRRDGRFHEESGALQKLERAYSLPMAALGTFMLLFGFFAFNGGSRGSISNPGDGAIVALAMTNTFLAGAAGGLTVFLLHRLTKSKLNLMEMMNGSLTGMVAICASCNVAHCYAAVIIGLVAGLFYLLFARLMIKLRVDDPLDAVAVHFGGGLWGVLAVVLFNPYRGILYTWNRQSLLDLGWQMMSICVMIAWASVVSLAVFVPLKMCGILRVPIEVEIRGIDIVKHGETEVINAEDDDSDYLLD